MFERMTMAAAQQAASDAVATAMGKRTAEAPKPAPTPAPATAPRAALEMTLPFRDFLVGKGLPMDKLDKAVLFAVDGLIDDVASAKRSFVGRNPATEEAMFAVSFLEAWWDRVGRARLAGWN